MHYRVSGENSWIYFHSPRMKLRYRCLLISVRLIIIMRIYWVAAAKSLQSCPTLRPQRRQPTRLPRPWDSPGKNTGVGCHFLLQCMKVKSESEVAQLSDSYQPHGLQPTRLLHPWDSPGKSTGVGCHCFLHRRDQIEHDPINSNRLSFSQYVPCQA